MVLKYLNYLKSRRNDDEEFFKPNQIYNYQTQTPKYGYGYAKLRC